MARKLYSLGGTATSRDLLDKAARWQLVQLGLATTTAQRGGRPMSEKRPTWTLTALGIAWCEGRAVEFAPPRPRGSVGARMRFMATWLASLPKGVRIMEGSACSVS